MAEVASTELAAACLEAARELALDGLRGARQAKRWTIQSYAQHSLAVAAAAARLARLLSERGVELAGGYAENLGLEPWLLGFLAGLVHDHNKAWGREERSQLERLVKSILERRGYVLEDKDVKTLVEDLYAVAEAAERGTTARTAAAGLEKLAWIVALSDLLASQTGLGAAEAALARLEPRYRAAVELLGEAGLELSTLTAARQSLVFAEASRRILEKAAEKGCEPLLVYHDGVLAVCPRGARLSYREAAREVLRVLVGESTGELEPSVEAGITKAAGRALGLGALAWNKLGGAGSVEPLEKLEECCRKGDAKSCRERMLEDAVAALAAAVADGLVGAREAAERMSKAKKPCKLQVKSVLGNAKAADEIIGSFGGNEVLAYADKLAREDRRGELAGLAALLATMTYKSGKCSKKALCGVLEKLPAEARGQLEPLQGTDYVSAFPAVLGVMLRLAREKGASILVDLVEAVVDAISGGARAGLEKFALYYTCTGLSGSLLAGKEEECRGADAPARAYCTICRAPLPDPSVGLYIKNYGDLLGMRGVAELWISDEKPFHSIELSQAKKAYGEAARRVCPACIYEASRLAKGIGVEKARSPLLYVYAIHPVAAPEQLVLAGLAVEAVAAVVEEAARGSSWAEVVEKLVDEAAAALGSGGLEERLGEVVIDYMGARILRSFDALGVSHMVDRDHAKALAPTMYHAAAGLAASAPLLAVLGGGAAISSSLASARLVSRPFSAGRRLLYLEEAMSCWGYAGAAAAALSFLVRAAPLASGRDAASAAISYLTRLEHLSSDPPLALLAPPEPRLLSSPRAERGFARRLPQLARLALLIEGQASPAPGGARRRWCAVAELVKPLRGYALAICCSIRGRSGGVSKHAVQGPLREALYTVLEYRGVLQGEDLVETAVGRAMEAARRRIPSIQQGWEALLRSSLKSLAERFAGLAEQLSPAKARQLAEALLDTAYLYTLDCVEGRWRDACSQKTSTSP